MIYPGYTPRIGIEPLILHYGLPFKVGNWSFSKLEHHEDGIVYDCNRLFPPPPFPREVDSLSKHISDVLFGRYLCCMQHFNITNFIG
jgi:hypothetical protein